MMSIDEAIAHAREKIEHKKKFAEIHTVTQEFFSDIDYEEQLAEWMEELKAYRAFDKTNFSDGYNKAVDDFYNSLADELIWIKERFGDDVYTDLWCSVGSTAEQLKAGE